MTNLEFAIKHNLLKKEGFDLAVRSNGIKSVVQSISTNSLLKDPWAKKFITSVDHQLYKRNFISEKQLTWVRHIWDALNLLH